MITAIIQARMSSTRLPGKVLLPLGDTTILGWVLRRVADAKQIGKVIVATTDRPDDDEIAAFCTAVNVELFRGDLNDVLDRYYQAAQHTGAEHIARITADCPLIDPAIIDSVALEYLKGDCDYISTGRIVSTFPDGMDTEIFSFSALEAAWQEAKLPSEREHVTPFIWNHPERFRVREVKSETDLSAIRLTVDEPRDYILVQDIVANASDLSMEGIVAYLRDNPAVAAANASITRDQGYQKSLTQDEKAKHQ